MKKLSASRALVDDLVAASRILAAHGVLDAYGHVSARSDKRPERFIMSRSRAPALVTAADLMELDPDSEALPGDKRKGFIERYIHGEIYRARPDVMAVVHSHSPSVIPFGRARPIASCAASKRRRAKSRRSTARRAEARRAVSKHKRTRRSPTS